MTPRLLYPEGPAPVLPHPKADQSAPLPSTRGEMLPLTDEQGVVIAQASRDWCHGGDKPLHPVVHLHIIDRYGRIYLQRRGAGKELFPLLWDTAVGGHIAYGEQPEQALVREAAEEIGLYDFNPVFLREHAQETEREREWVYVFAIVGSYPLQPDGVEVSEGRWWTEDEIRAAMGKGLLTPFFEAEFPQIRRSLFALL